MILGLRVISDYLSTRESGESGVCPSCVGLWETSMSLSSMLFMGIECCVVSLYVVGADYRFGGAEAFFSQKPCFSHGFHFQRLITYRKTRFQT